LLGHAPFQDFPEGENRFIVRGRNSRMYYCLVKMHLAVTTPPLCRESFRAKQAETPLSEAQLTSALISVRSRVTAFPVSCPFTQERHPAGNLFLWFFLSGFSERKNRGFNSINEVFRTPYIKVKRDLMII